MEFKKIWKGYRYFGVINMEVDYYLEKRMEKYDKWVEEGKILTPSKVIPSPESVTNLQWVLPTNQVLEILRNSETIALTDCDCRLRYKNCDKPLDVCLLLDNVANIMVQKKKARYIDLDEAMGKIELANKHGLVHLTLYHPKHNISALCSCCECCCHDIQIMKKFERPDYIAHSDYIAEIDKSSCINCGLCKERCIFDAYEKGDIITYNSKKCYGCGVCLTTCPTQSITLKLRINEK